MPTATLYPADAGYWTGWHSITGAATAWQAVDETPHDSDATYFRMPNALAALPLHSGRVSVRLSQMGLARLMPSTVTLSVMARVNLAGPPGTNAQLQAGFTDARHEVYAGSPFAVAAASYTQYDTVMATNPITGATWRRGELAGLELHLQTHLFPTPAQQCRVTAWWMTIEYDDPTNYCKRGPGAVTS